jgi:hypothetical protein
VIRILMSDCLMMMERMAQLMKVRKREDMRTFSLSCGIRTLVGLGNKEWRSAETVLAGWGVNLEIK